MFKAIKQFFKRIGGRLRKLWSILKKVFNGALELFLAELMTFATETVKALANTDLSNDDKRKEAFNKIKNKAIGRGIYYKDNWVNILLEIAVAKIKLEL